MSKSVSKNIALAAAYAEEMKEMILSCCESVKDSASMTEAWNSIDKCYQDLESLRNHQKCTGSKSFPLKHISTDWGVEGHTRYLQGLDLPIKINSIADENDELIPSDVSEMHIGDINGVKTLIITPEIISLPEDDTGEYELDDTEDYQQAADWCEICKNMNTDDMT